MISFSQTWQRITKQLKRKRSFQSQESCKAVRFYDIDTIFYTHSSFEYDRSPTVEHTEDSYLDDDDDTDDDDDDHDDDDDRGNTIGQTSTHQPASIFASSHFPPNSTLSPSPSPSPSLSFRCSVKMMIVDNHHPLGWEKSLT